MYLFLGVIYAKVVIAPISTKHHRISIKRMYYFYLIVITDYRLINTGEKRGTCRNCTIVCPSSKKQKNNSIKEL